MNNALFSYHPSPSTEQKSKLANVEKAFNEAARVIQENTTDKRYAAIAITELEKSGAMAAKGIFKNSDGSFIPGAQVETVSD